MIYQKETKWKTNRKGKKIEIGDIYTSVQITSVTAFGSTVITFNAGDDVKEVVKRAGGNLEDKELLGDVEFIKFRLEDKSKASVELRKMIDDDLKERSEIKAV